MDYKELTEWQKSDSENRLQLSLENAAVELNEARVAASRNNDIFAAIGKLLASLRRVQKKVAAQSERT